MLTSLCNIHPDLACYYDMEKAGMDVVYIVRCCFFSEFGFLMPNLIVFVNFCLHFILYTSILLNLTTAFF